MTSATLFNLTTLAYFAAMVLFLVYLATRSRGAALAANVVTWVGFAVNTAAFALR